ncbi:MAG TPA: hypothetical protein VFP68_20180 [Burkholderiaceae bacterium]|nr:hypothetical protein [Burkholderiaceae bacterium]
MAALAPPDRMSDLWLKVTRPRVPRHLVTRDRLLSSEQRLSSHPVILVQLVDEADRLPAESLEPLAYLLRNTPSNLHAVVAARKGPVLARNSRRWMTAGPPTSGLQCVRQLPAVSFAEASQLRGVIVLPAIDPDSCAGSSMQD